MVQTGGEYVTYNQSYPCSSFQCFCFVRITEFNFIVDEEKEEPTITFTGEQPYLQYVRIIAVHF